MQLHFRTFAPEHALRYMFRQLLDLQEIFLSFKTSDQLWNPTSLYSMGTEGSFPGGKAVRA